MEISVLLASCFQTRWGGIDGNDQAEENRKEG